MRGNRISVKHLNDKHVSDARLDHKIPRSRTHLWEEVGKESGFGIESSSSLASTSSDILVGSPETMGFRHLGIRNSCVTTLMPFSRNPHEIESECRERLALYKLFRRGEITPR